ncbi:MAG: sigma-70 family RNA polymerase sigma factor [Thermoanaerobaculia bacterium]|nr:sigma-70 family RNA polymerase sigma factor [Thermoanaerobaculia bacterium]
MSADSSDFFNALRARIRGFAASRLGVERADDVAQETIVVLLQKYRHIPPGEELVKTAFGVARLRMLGTIRDSARNREDAIEGAEFASVHPNPESEALLRQAVARLESVLPRLGAKCRLIFRMRLEALSSREMKERLQAKSEAAVQLWAFRCRKKALELLGGDWLPFESGGRRAER